MRVLYVSAEVAPFAKVGGLADVAASLPKALRALGHDVRVVMPAYRMVEYDPRWIIETEVGGVHVSLNPGWNKRAYLRCGVYEDVPIYLLGTDEWFNKAQTSETIYRPGCDQYLFFAAALLECFAAKGWIPDVVHTNDWHTGFVPVLMREQHGAQWSEAAALHTIHNLAYQGEFGFEVLDKVGLPHHLFNLHRLEAHNCVNFLKAGCVYSDQTNTVSPRYAQEIQTPEYGCGLDGLMRHLNAEGRLTGILNGLDPQTFDPASDPKLPAHYSADERSGKAECKRAVLHEVGLKPMREAPLASVISRLSEQKGFDLLDEILPQLVALPMQVVVLAIGDPYSAARLRVAEARFGDRVRFVERFDPDLAQRLYAGSDMFLMPSAFEPCGLGQLIALRYGTVPVVRETGGLADTVHEGQNGFVFGPRDSGAFLDACRRAHAAYGTPDWDALVDRGMRMDLGWEASAKRYEQLYEVSQARRSDRAVS